MKRLTMLASLLLALVLGLVGTEAVSAQDVAVQADNGNDGVDYDCGQFTYQEDAQEYFNGDGGSASRNVDDLDGSFSQNTPNEPDGFVCESRPQRPVQNPSPSPAPARPSSSPQVTPAPSAENSTEPSTDPSDEASLTPSPIETSSPSPSTTSSVEPTPSPSSVDLPGEIAPDAITIEASTSIDDNLAGTITYTVFGDSAIVSGTSKQAQGPPADAIDLTRAPGVTIVVIDETTGAIVDTGTTDSDGLVTLDGEYGVPVFVIVGGTETGSDTFVIPDGATASVDVVLFQASGDQPASSAPTVAPTVAAGSSAPAASSAGATTLPNTGSGQTQRSNMTTMALLLALFAGAAIALGTFGLVRGRRG